MLVLLSIFECYDSFRVFLCDNLAATTSAITCLEILICESLGWGVPVCVSYSIKHSSLVLDAGDYEGALARLTEMIYLLHDQLSMLSSATGQHVGVLADVTTSCEILRVFLLLLLQVHITLDHCSIA